MKIDRLDYTESMTATQTNLMPMGAYSHENRRKYYQKKRFYIAQIESSALGLIERVVVPMHYTPKKTKRRKLCLVDAVTGSIYNPRTKKCLTSTTLELINVRHNQALAIQMLKESFSSNQESDASC